MDMLRAMNILKEDLQICADNNNRLKTNDYIFNCYSDNRGIPKGRMIQFYGSPDCGKTTLMRYLIKSNEDKLFIYISSKKDDINKVKYPNAHVLISNIFEDTIDYIEKIEKDYVDFIIIDNIHNMLSTKEQLSAFDEQIDNRKRLNEYIKKLSILAAQKNFILIIINGRSGVSHKSKYGYIIEKEVIANFEMIRALVDKEKLMYDIIPRKNLISNNKGHHMFSIRYDNIEL